MASEHEATALPPADPGPALWRGLEELVETDEFRQMMSREFPDQADQWTDPVTRRQFLTLMGASLALAGLGGCSVRPAAAEKILPYVVQPEQIVPGKPLFYATAMTLGGVASGLIVESHEGRPTKVEGNPTHPDSKGATDLYAQASILGLYDPDRSQSITYRGRPRSWAEALRDLRGALEKQASRRGAGIRILTETVTSPTLHAQLRQFLEQYPDAKWYQYEPVGRDAARAASKQAFGRSLTTRYDFSKADVVVALDSDFLTCGPGSLTYTREFSARRRVRTKDTPADKLAMNRLFVIEPTLTNTGAKADERLALRADRIEHFARVVAAQLGIPGVPAAGALSTDERNHAESVGKTLGEHRGTSIVLTGDSQPASVHALVHAINNALGNDRPGGTVIHTRSMEAEPVDQMAQIRELATEMSQRKVEMLVVLGGNPVYTAPADLEFAKNLALVPLRIHLGLYQDETAILCDWHIHESHYLESWGDARAFDGTVTIQQPLIAPLYAGRSALELLAALSVSPERLGLDIVREYWREQAGTVNFEHFWQKALRDGVVENTAFPPETNVTLAANWAGQAQPASEAGQGLEIVFRPDPAVYDGRFANNGWLQELPRAITRLTWDNAAIVSPKTAKEKLGIDYTAPGKIGRTGGERGRAFVDVFELEYRGRKVTAPVWILPGHADDSITIHLGYGRTNAGRVGTGAGFNAYQLRTSDRPWFDTGLQARRTGQEYTLAGVQLHHSMEGRRPVHSMDLVEFRDQVQKHDAHGEKGEKHPGPPDRRLVPLTLYDKEDFEPPTYRWGMAIDLTTCTGCSACVVACQAENNIPVVGKTEVSRGREMHWLRIDRYYQGEAEKPEAIFFQPVPCMHCENAPCELVCPVAATVHSHDGLNDMVYNRCVGTRYCSNNCPYKVRRFNFLQYADFNTPSLKLLHNPDVTVRSRGVMEKCTYCVQRIRGAEIQAEREGRRIREHEVATACQAACPAHAITFGDLNDERSEVRRWKDETQLHYGLLAELNTEPRTTYLAALRNPSTSERR